MSSSDRQRRVRQIWHGAGTSSRSPASLGPDAHSSRNSQVRRLGSLSGGWPQNSWSASCRMGRPPHYPERETPPGLESCPRRCLLGHLSNLLSRPWAGKLSKKRINVVICTSSQLRPSQSSLHRRFRELSTLMAYCKSASSFDVLRRARVLAAENGRSISPASPAVRLPGRDLLSGT
jgi:hypothetical protein